MKTIFGVPGFALSEYAIAANAILGIRDSGKTYTATEASEELYEASVPFIWLDPIGVAHNLRIPGKGRGYPVVVAGGKHGDLPLTVKGVGDLVRSAMKANISLVLDLFSVELSKADWRRIVKETCEILLHENSDYGLRHVFIEEAAEFVPQRVTDGQTFAAVEKLVRMGGNSKVGITLINQRSADLNKSVLELCANVFVHRQTGKNTLQDLKKWLGLIDPAMEKKITASLPDLKSGQCWVMSNELKTPVLIKVPEKNSLHPDRRAATLTKAEAAKRQPVPADAFVSQMKAALAEKAKPAAKPVASQAVAKINTADQKTLERAIWEARTEGHAIGHGQGFAAGHRLGFDQGVKRTKALYREAFEGIGPNPAYIAPPDGSVPKVAKVTAAAPASASMARPTMSPRPTVGGKVISLPPGERAVLIAAAQFDGVEREQLTVLTGYKRSSRDAYIQRLREKGLVEVSGSTVRVTISGADALPPDYEPLPTGEALQQYWLGRLPEGERKILEILIDAYPRAVERQAIDDATGYKRSSRDAYLQRMKAKRLWTADGGGVRMAEALA